MGERDEQHYIVIALNWVLLVLIVTTEALPLSFGFFEFLFDETLKITLFAYVSNVFL